MATVNDIEGYIARVALGDRAAFDALYNAVSAKLFGVSLRVLNNHTEAEDVLQEVFVKIWRNANRYSANGLSPMTWLITIARNTAIDRLRKQRMAVTGLDQAVELADAKPGPEAIAVARSEGGRISLCLDRLDANKSKAVQMAYLDGYSYAELSDHFNVPLNTVRTWLRRSLLKLKECLSNDQG
jgi:RNA polymerase sigma-70 factor, ECF subfamily